MPHKSRIGAPHLHSRFRRASEPPLNKCRLGQRPEGIRDSQPRRRLVCTRHRPACRYVANSTERVGCHVSNMLSVNVHLEPPCLMCRHYPTRAETCQQLFSDPAHTPASTRSILLSIIAFSISNRIVLFAERYARSSIIWSRSILCLFISSSCFGL